MKIIITEEKLQKVLKETMDGDGSKSEAVFLPDVTPFKFATWEKQGLKAYMYDKSSLELKLIENFKQVPKLDTNKKSWSSSHLLVLTTDDYDKFNRLTTKVNELIKLEEERIKLLKEHTQAVIFKRFKK